MCFLNEYKVGGNVSMNNKNNKAVGEDAIECPMYTIWILI